MAFSGQLGGELAVLGGSLSLGFGEAATPPDPTNQTVNQSFGFTVTATYDPVINRSINQSLGLNAGQSVEALYRAVSQQLFGGGTGSSAIPDEYREVAEFLGFTRRTFVSAGNVLEKESTV